MDILQSLKQLRDDIKTWVTNNLNALNAKIDEKTIPIDNELSSTSTNPVQNKIIKKAIDNIPKFSGDYNDLTNAPNISEDESGNMIIADESGNIIFKADSDGIHTTAVSLNGEAAASEKYVDEAIANNVPKGYATENFVTDAIKSAKEELSESIVAESEDLKVVDGSGNIILSVDEYGTHTTNLISHGVSAEFVMISDDTGNNGGYIEYQDNEGDAAALAFAGARGDEPVILRHIANPITDGDAANKIYVDSKVSEYLPLSGGTITGDVMLSEGKILLGNSIMRTAEWVDGNYGQSPFKIYTDQEDYEYIIGGGRIGGLTMPPSNDTDATNKAYVDDAINAVKEDFGESITSEATEWKVVDGNGNIIFSVDANGAHTTSITINGKTIQEMIREYVDEAILGGAW